MSEEITIGSSPGPCRQRREWEVHPSVPIDELAALLNRLSGADPPWEFEMENLEGGEESSSVPGYEKERKVCVTASREVCACRRAPRRAEKRNGETP